MGLFWKRKSGDQFVSLKLNEPLPEKASEKIPEETGQTAPDRTSDAGPAQAPSLSREVEAALSNVPPSASRPVIEAVPTGGGPTPMPSESSEPKRPGGGLRHSAPQGESEAAQVSRVEQKPVATVPSRSPFATSILGLNLSIEELQAQEAALEQEFSARFRRAVSATRETLSEKIDTVFAGRKQIDDDLLDELEEALIATDIGVTTTLEILEKVRRGIARHSINDLDALKQAIKDELLKILRAAEAQGI